uniref:DUF19 domain-containing protein n=1 Tax=Romanomermis culicivorax TaxID=13658 RepID=A0A915I5Y1_ROMCU
MISGSGQAISNTLSGAGRGIEHVITVEYRLEASNCFSSNYKSFHECSREIQCNSSSLRAVKASYGYMCTRGYEKFAEKVQCFTQVEASPSYQTCRILASRSFSLPQSTTMNESFDVKSLDKLCNAMRSYLKCSKNVLVQVCDESAWHLVFKMTVESIRITMPDCDIDVLED